MAIYIPKIVQEKSAFLQLIEADNIPVNDLLKTFIDVNSSLNSNLVLSPDSSLDSKPKLDSGLRLYDLISKDVRGLKSMRFDNRCKFSRMNTNPLYMLFQSLKLIEWNLKNRLSLESMNTPLTLQHFELALELSHYLLLDDLIKENFVKFLMNCWRKGQLKSLTDSVPEWFKSNDGKVVKTGIFILDYLNSDSVNELEISSDFNECSRIIDLLETFTTLSALASFYLTQETRDVIFKFQDLYYTDEAFGPNITNKFNQLCSKMYRLVNKQRVFITTNFGFDMMNSIRKMVNIAGLILTASRSRFWNNSIHIFQEGPCDTCKYYFCLNDCYYNNNDNEYSNYYNEDVEDLFVPEPEWY
jgi:hypothetical protein